MPALDPWVIYDHPIRSKNDKGVLVDKPIWTPHKGQLIIANNYTTNQVLDAGRRFGKSINGAKKLLPEAFVAKSLANQLKIDGVRREFWIVGPEYSDAEKEFRVIYNDLRALGVPFDRPGTYNDPIGGSLHISLWEGTFQIHGKSSKYPEQLVGEGLCGAIMSEAAKQKEIIWDKFIRPTLLDFNGWSFHSSTPEGKNHFYKHWQFGQDPANKDWASWKMPSWRNHFVFTEETVDEHVYRLVELSRQNPGASIYSLAEQHRLIIDSKILGMINDSTPESFLQEIAAEFTEFVGRVFKEFDEETHVTDLVFNPAWQTVGAVDYGFTNPSVWLLVQLGPWGEINVLDEIYEEGLDPTEFAAEIKRRQLNPQGLHFFYPDPADPAASQILERTLGIRAKAGTGGELNNRLNHIRKALKTPRTVIDEHSIDLEETGLYEGETRPQLMFDRRCARTIQDFLNYRYPDKKEETSTKQQELPMKKDDHGPEALGRMFAGIFGSYAKPGGARMHKANFSTRSRKEKEKVQAVTPKSPGFMRPALHERTGTDFPKVNKRTRRL